MDQDTPMNTGFGSTGFGSTTASDTGTSRIGTESSVCPTCGHDKNAKGLDQFLAKLGISDEMVSHLKSSLNDVDVDQYLNTAREYLRTGGTKASTFAKENPGKVAAGVAVLAIGAGMLLKNLRE